MDIYQEALLFLEECREKDLDEAEKRSSQEPPPEREVIPPTIERKGPPYRRAKGSFLRMSASRKRPPLSILFILFILSIVPFFPRVAPPLLPLLFFVAFVLFVDPFPSSSPGA